MPGENQACITELSGFERSVPTRRVLLAVNLNPSQKFGSLEEQIFLLSKAMAEEGGLLIPVFAHEMDDIHRARYKESDLSVRTIDLNGFRISALRRLLKLIDDFQIQVVHWNLYSPTNLYVPLLRLLRPSTRHILTDHNSRPKGFERTGASWKKMIKRPFATAYAGIYAVSDYVMNDLKSQAVWGEPLRFYHFVNTDRFMPDTQAGAVVRASMKCDDAFVVLVVANLIPEKGVDVLIQALSKMPPRAVLWVIGDGPALSGLMALARKLELQDRVMFLGLCEDVCRYMQAAHCFVCPSLWQEAAGLVILEAMACGLPVVASSVGGIPEFVVAGRTGYLIPPGDPNAMVECLKALLLSPALAMEMATSGRAHAVAHFSHATRVADALSMYTPAADEVGPNA